MPLKVETDLQVGNQLSFVFDKGEVAQVAETSLTQTGIDEYVFEMWRDGQVLIDDTFALNPSGPTIQPLGFIKRVFLNCMAKESGLTSAVSSRVYAACSAVCFAGPLPCATCVAVGAGIDLSTVLVCANRAWK